MRSEDHQVVEATAALVRRSWSLLGGEPRPPLRTDHLSALLTRTNTRLCEYPFLSGAVGGGIPLGAEGHTIPPDSTAARADYEFTIRHELAHVLSGEVSETLFLSAADTMSFSERRADLFAVTDLVPAWLISQLRGTRRAWSRVTLDVQQAFRELTEGWSEERLRDRAGLRTELYRREGI